MALEVFSYISSLVPANPTSTDPVSQGDDQIRGIKTTLVNSFPNISSAVTATAAQLNSTTTLATTYAPLASPAFTGNPTAPTAAPGDNDTTIATTAYVTAADNQVRVAQIGNGFQQWRNSGKSKNVTYTNTSAAPIMVNILTISYSYSQSCSINCDGIAVAIAVAVSNSSQGFASAIIPPGRQYSVTGGASISSWTELS